jgi:hypothetical protein
MDRWRKEEALRKKESTWHTPNDPEYRKEVIEAIKDNYGEQLFSVILGTLSTETLSNIKKQTLTATSHHQNKKCTCYKINFSFRYIGIGNEDNPDLQLLCGKMLFRTLSKSCLVLATLRRILRQNTWNTKKRDYFLKLNPGTHEKVHNLCEILSKHTKRLQQRYPTISAVVFCSTE